tara:strand:- start:245 stop:943 length:699 start_codon:yes stop_codon:yes gene_type:complete
MSTTVYDPEELKKIIEDILEAGKSHAIKGYGNVSEWDNETELRFPNPSVSIDDDSLKLLEDYIEKYYIIGDSDEHVSYELEAQRIMSKGKTIPELDVEFHVHRSWTDYEHDVDVDTFDVNEYEADGIAMTRDEKIEYFGLENVTDHEVGTFSGSGDDGEFLPTGGDLGNDDFQKWIKDRAESLMENCSPNFNNEGSYGDVLMSIENGEITLTLNLNSGFEQNEKLVSMEEII